MKFLPNSPSKAALACLAFMIVSFCHQFSSPGTTYKSSFPEWYVHEEATCKQDSNTPSKNKRQIIAFDDMSCWKR